jgi:ferredoxin-NADP reductase
MNDRKPLAGGIGITPFFGIVKQADHDHAPHKLTLFYSNRRPEDGPFLDENPAPLGWDSQGQRSPRPTIEDLTLWASNRRCLLRFTLTTVTALPFGTSRDAR